MVLGKKGQGSKGTYMALNLTIPGHDDLKPRITVFGVGGAGGNAVNNMIQKQLDGVEFVVANTDAQALAQSLSTAKIQMGVKVTEGLGAGARPSVGAAAAEETIEEIVDHLAGAHMCFITAGMGGGTGTGAAPIIAQAARELGVLTVGVVTKPFQFEGGKRMRQAEEGVEALQKMVDTLIIIPNQNLFRLANEKTTFTEAFAMADDVLYQGVKGVTDLMVRPGLINLDFADVRAVMDEMGKAMMGTGEAEGEDRAQQAAEKAIANPLLDEISLNGAKGVLINITGGHDLTLFELDEAANVIREKVDKDANIIVGSTLDETMTGKMRVSVVATGIDAAAVDEVPVPRRRLSEPLTAARDAEPATTAVAPAPEEVSAAFFHDAALGDEDEDDLFAEEDGGAGDADAPGLPLPAYRPAAAATPAARTATPSPEALARLEAAVRKMPPGASAGAYRPAASGAAPGATERPRFGINSLINRMTGHPAETAAERPAAVRPAPRPAPRAAAVAVPPPAPARQPAPTIHRFDDEGDEAGDADRIEIPAFLRRQAN